MKKFAAGLLLTFTVALGVFMATAPAYAAPSTSAAKAQVCSGVSGTSGGSCGNGGVDISRALKGVLNLLSVIAGIAAVIIIIISGLRYITSQGEAQAVSGAKRTLIYAIVGLVVVAMAQLIVHYVLARTK